MAALLFAVGLCAALWKVLESWGGSPRTSEVGIPRVEEETARSQGTATPVLQPEKSVREPPVAAPEPPVVAVRPIEVEPKVRLFGSILDARDRTPITGDSRLRIADMEWEERTVSEQIDGKYEFVDLHAGSWEITAEVSGFQTLKTRAVLDPDEKKKRVDLVLLPAFAVKVRVEGVGGEDLQMIPVSNYLRFDGIRRDAVRAASSQAERWIAHGAPDSMDVLVRPTVVEPGRWLTGDLQRSDRVGTFVTRDALPSDLLVRELERMGALRTLPKSKPLVERSEDPKYCGVLELSEPPPLFASLVLREFVLKTVPIPAGADEVAFVLKRDELRTLLGRVRLRVVDADSDAIPEGLSVRIDQSGLETPGTDVETDGSITFANLLPGSALLTITAPEREIIVERVLVQPSTTTDLGTYRMQSFASIEGKVVDDAGEPASVLFNVFPLDRYESTRATLATRFFRSSREGVLKIDSVGHGRYLIVAHDDTWSSSPVLADTTFRQKESVQIRVSKGTSVVLRLRADPPPNGRLAIRTRSGLPVADCACRTRDPMRFQLAPGNYSVELSDGETWLWSEGLAVGADPVRSYLPR